MKKLITICLIVLLCTASSLARPTVPADQNAMIGNYTGPIGGVEQDDNIKASLDLAHIDVDAVITSLGIVRDTNSSIFYVDAGIAGSTGVSWATAVADVEAATALCTAGNKDIIAIAPGHVESMTAADDIDLDKSGVIMIGFGQGDARPTFSYTANGEVELGADNVGVYNCRFIATSDSVILAINVQNGIDGFTIADCEFSAETTTVDEFDDVIIIGTTASRGLITRNKFLGDVGSNSDPQSCINFNTANYLEISDNEFYGDRAVACIENAAASNWPIIKDNILFNGIIGGTAGLNAQPCIELHASTSALITNNRLYCNVATEDLAIVAADGFLDGNTYNESEGSFLNPGQMYAMEVTAGVAASTDDLFLVAGGPIEIVSFFGLITTVIGGAPGDINIEIDATTAAQDADFSTAVTLSDALDGDTITFATVTAGESVLVANANVNASLTPLSWFCPIGTIESATTSTGTGAIKWYMVFRPLTTGVTVTAAP